MFLVLALILIGIGVWSYQRLPIDAVPDITNVQVQINTKAPGYSPLEAEQRITFPVETALYGLPKPTVPISFIRTGTDPFFPTTTFSYIHWKGKMEQRYPMARRSHLWL